MKRNDYQLGYSRQHADSMYNQARRQKKAEKALAIVIDYFTAEGKSVTGLSLLDIGCSTGFLTRLYANAFHTVVGIDIDEEALEYAKAHNGADNITYLIGDGMDIDLPSSSFDIITCSHIYEHVPDAELLFTEIHRLLKTGGICYFAAKNRFDVMEAHYHLPFLSFLPKSLAHLYLRITGKGSFYYEKHLTLWGLRKLVRRFEIIDYTEQIIQEPERFSADDLLVSGTLKQRLSLFIVSIAYWLSPTYVWLLKKKQEML